jgi:CRP-like cAMP-binding protein
MLGIGAMQQFPPDKRLIDEGDEESKVVYLLLAGMVKVTGAMDFGDALLAIRIGGDIVGEVAALDNHPRLASVTTAGPVVARVIGQAEFVSFLARHSDIALEITRGVTTKLRSATAHRIDFAGCTAAVRLARVLHELASGYGARKPEGTTILCPLTQTELATLAGTTEPTAQRALRQLREAGVITSAYRETTIRDMAALRRHALLPTAHGRINGPEGIN